VLFIVQSPYWFAIGCRVVFSLGGWTPHIQPGFHEPEFNRWAGQFTITGLSPSAARHSNASFVSWFIRFRSPLLTESLLLSFPVDTEMFHFSTFASSAYTFSGRYPCGWVAPFRYPEITAWLPAPSGFSQVPTSFIASRHQDIHHVPLCPVANRTPRLAHDCSLRSATPLWLTSPFGSRSRTDLRAADMLPGLPRVACRRRVMCIALALQFLRTLCVPALSVRATTRFLAFLQHASPSRCAFVQRRGSRRGPRSRRDVFFSRWYPVVKDQARSAACCCQHLADWGGECSIHPRRVKHAGSAF
jgi:hypothetical protein